LVCEASAAAQAARGPMTSVQIALLIATFNVAGARPTLRHVGVSPHEHAGTAPQTHAAESPRAVPPSPIGWPAIQDIRTEIRRRIPFLQSCSDAARRRGASDVRRLHATWSIAPDGSTKVVKVEQEMDPEMAACLARAGGRRFSVAPGIELSVPVSIVFVP
jgi:hypothetical protein